MRPCRPPEARDLDLRNNYAIFKQTFTRAKCERFALKSFQSVRSSFRTISRVFFTLHSATASKINSSIAMQRVRNAATYQYLATMAGTEFSTKEKYKLSTNVQLCY